MASKKYLLPEFLMGRCTPEDYWKWLDGRATQHARRDRNRGHPSARREGYMVAIHAAVIRSGGVDDYTGKRLRGKKSTRMTTLSQRSYANSTRNPSGIFRPLIILEK